jgi:RNA polymerase sigma-70 factor (ECF subfamily)
LTATPLAELYDEFGARLYRYALLILADASAAEDAVQEAFCALSRAAARDPTLANAAYLTAIVRNECYTALRRQRREPPGDGPLVEPRSPEATAEEQLVFNAALRALPAEQREAIYLKVFEGLTFQEIGDRCGCSLNTAASRYRYALAALRTTLDIDRSRG